MDLILQRLRTINKTKNNFMSNLSFNKHLFHITHLKDFMRKKYYKYWEVLNIKISG